MNEEIQTKKDRELGLFFAIICSVIWGVLPAYWKTLDSIPSILIMFYRLVLLCILVFLIDLKIYKWEGIIKPLCVKGAPLKFFFAGLLISANWSLYIYMVNADLIVQTTIGYYIEPLIVCLFGYLFFREKLEPYKLIAILLAIGGITEMLLNYGGVPLLSLVLAFTFSGYAAMKKKINAPALLSLFYETVFLVPIVLPIILYYEFTGQGAFSVSGPMELGLLSLSGLFTAVPLALFAMAANRVSLITLGITEYIAPSIALILGIYFYGEPFNLDLFIGFVIIWIGLVVFTIGGIMENKKAIQNQQILKASETSESGGDTLCFTESKE